MTHRILTEHPEHRRLVAERAKLAASRQAFHARQAEAESTFRQAQADHDREAHEALLEGREPPPAPSYKPPAGDYAIFEGEENRLIHDERRFHAEQGGELRRALAGREAELLREAEVVLSQLAPIVDELNRVVGAARVVDAGQRAFANAYGRTTAGAAAGSTTAPSTSARSSTPWDPAGGSWASAKLSRSGRLGSSAPAEGQRVPAAPGEPPVPVAVAMPAGWR
jgi:hypothetical protein